MSIIYIGTNMVGRLIEDFPLTIEIDDTDVVRGKARWTTRFGSAVALASAITSHPEFPFLEKVKATVTREEADIAIVEIDFEGVDDTSSGVTKTQRTTATTGNAPIETHPEFDVWSPPFEPAIDEQTGAFKGFPLKLGVGGSGGPNKFAGVKNYLVPSIIFEETRSFKGATSVSFSQVGRKDAAPSGSPNLPPGANWLQVGGTVEKRGNGFTITRRWRASGPRGWYDEVYG